MERRDVKGSYAAPALEKGFEVLELMADRPDGMLISEMSVQLGRSVGELFRIVIVMERLGYLRKSATTDRYTVAYKLLDVAMRATPAQHLVRAALPEMRALALAAGQSCHLVVADGGHGLVVACEQQPGTRGFSLRVGARIDILKSCSGQVILAFSDPPRTAQIVASAVEEQGAPIDEAALAKRLVTIRSKGSDSRKSPITYGVTDVSYPVLGFDGYVVAALTIPFLELIDGSQKVGIAEARRLLERAVARISDALGHQNA